MEANRLKSRDCAITWLNMAWSAIAAFAENREVAALFVRQVTLKAGPAPIVRLVADGVDDAAADGFPMGLVGGEEGTNFIPRGLAVVLGFLKEEGDAHEGDGHGVLV